MNSSKDQNRREKILYGNLFATIVTICAPLFLYSFINSFYSLIDSIVVSKINASSVSAVASLTQIQSLLSSLGAGLSAGGGVIVARKFGASQFKEAKKTCNALLFISTIIIVVLLTICLTFNQLIMNISGVPKELISIGTGYFIIQIIDLSFVFYNCIFIAMNRSKGNTKIIFVLNFLSMFIKLGLTVLFVYVFKVDDIIWVAVATLIGQIVMFIIFLVGMMKKDNVYKIDFTEFRFEKSIIKDIIIISFPIFLGKFIFSFGKVSVNAMCKNYGPLVVGALGVSNNLCGIATNPLSSFEEGGSTIVSQNLGNKNIKRALKAFVRCFIMSVSLGIIGYILIRFILQDELISLFNQNKQAQDTAEFLVLIKTINKYDSLSIIALSINSAVLGVLYGFGKTKIAMIINISRAFVFRIPILWYFQTFHKEIGPEAVGISMGVSNICIAIMSTSFLGYFIIKIKKNGYHGLSLK